MPLPSSDTPLYNHSLPDLETWLTEQGCKQDLAELHCWRVARPAWKAELYLDTDQLTVRYFEAEGEEIQRSFKYLLSRQDVEDAVFSGP